MLTLTARITTMLCIMAPCPDDLARTAAGECVEIGDGDAGGLGSPGGGGRYSEGAVSGQWSDYSESGGGGSYNVGSNQQNTSAQGSSDGWVEITAL